MNHEEVYRIFKTLFPLIAEHVVDWFPNGRQSIRFRLTENEPLSDYVFSYSGTHDWCYETVGSYLKRMKGEKLI